MKVDYIEETTVRKALAFEIESEVVEKEIEARARDYARKVKLPGFRPGKIPAEVIKRRFRSQVLEDAAEAIVNRVVFDELEGRGLRPLGSPRVSELKIDENQPMTFRATFETLPLVELPEYRGLEVRARNAEVGEDQVDKEIDRMREDAARYDAIEGRPARSGDFVVLDVSYAPAADEHRAGQRPRPRKDENVLVEVGSGDNHADLNAALEGMSPGEAKDVRLVYAEDHPQRNLAGRRVDYSVALKAVKHKVVPAADDEFAKDLDMENLAELRENVRTRLLALEQRRAERETKNALLEQLVDRASFEVPDALVERHMNARTENAARDLALQGIDPSKTGVDWRQFRETQREASIKAAKADILLDEIGRREAVEVLPAELDAELERLAAGLRKSKEALRSQMEKEGGLAGLRARILEDKVLDLLKANARLTYE